MEKGRQRGFIWFPAGTGLEPSLGAFQALQALPPKFDSLKNQRFLGPKKALLFSGSSSVPLRFTRENQTSLNGRVMCNKIVAFTKLESIK